MLSRSGLASRRGLAIPNLVLTGLLSQQFVIADDSSPDEKSGPDSSDSPDSPDTPGPPEPLKSPERPVIEAPKHQPTRDAPKAQPTIEAPRPRPPIEPPSPKPTLVRPNLPELEPPRHSVAAAPKESTFQAPQPSTSEASSTQPSSGKDNNERQKNSRPKDATLTDGVPDTTAIPRWRNPEESSEFMTSTVAVSSISRDLGIPSAEPIIPSSSANTAPRGSSKTVQMEIGIVFGVVSTFYISALTLEYDGLISCFSWLDTHRSSIIHLPFPEKEKGRCRSLAERRSTQTKAPVYSYNIQARDC